MARSLLAATLVSLGVAAVPATARAGLLSDILTPVVDLLDGGGSAAHNSGPGNAGGQLPDPPAPTAPPPPIAPTAPTPVAPTAPASPAGPGASNQPGAPTAPAVPPAPGAPAAPATPGAPVALVVAPPLRPARPTSPVSLRYLVGRHLLRPPAGTVVGGLRPKLRWRGGPAHVDLYNVQIFTATGAKVMSAFPRSRAFRIPPKRLGPGRRYVWRVWPYTRTHGYTRKPLALSWFATLSRTVLAAR